MKTLRCLILGSAVLGLNGAVFAQALFEGPELLLSSTNPSTAETHSGDLNGDGLDDAVLVAEGRVRTWLGVAGSTPDPRSSKSVPGVGRLWALADLDVDGALDLLVDVAGAAHVLRGRGNGTFHDPVMAAPSFHRRPAVADLTGDGVPDLLENWPLSQGFLRTSQGLGNGQFVPGAPLTLPEASAPLGDVLLADLDADGLVDLVTVPLSGAAPVRIRAGLTGGGFEPTPVDLTVDGAFLLRALALDVDGDGQLDLLVHSTDGLHMRLGRGDLAFGPERLQEGPVHDLLGATDLDRDGAPDLLFQSDTHIEIWSGDGSGGFAADTSIPNFAPFLTGVGWGDVDGEGGSDLWLVRLSTVDQTGFAWVRNASYGPGSHLEDLVGEVAGELWAPVLVASGGAWTGGGLGFEVTGGRPDAEVWLAIGTARQDTPLAGGVLVPRPDRILALGRLDGSGRHAVELPMPGVWAGGTLFAQAWVADDTAPRAWAATGGVRIQFRD